MRVLVDHRMPAPGDRGYVEALVPRAYADTPTHLHRLAARSLLAHLGKLEQDGRALSIDGQWSLRAT